VPLPGERARTLNTPGDSLFREFFITCIGI